jgi:hypothetical protein
MSCDLQTSGAIDLYFYDELDARERQSVAQHLGSCRECRQALEDLTEIRRALSARPDVSTPPAGDWSGFMSRLDSAIAREGDLVRPFRVAAPPSRVAYSGYIAMAALLAIVTMSVFAVFKTRQTTPQDAKLLTGAAQDAAAPSDGDPALVALSERHFEKSKLVVLGIANKDAESQSEADWKYERELAASLLNDTRLYRRAAEDHNMKALAGVLQDLEIVLLQTSMTEAPDKASLAQIQRLIRKRDLVDKMDVVGGASVGSVASTSGS